jgi:glycosyltransferase involved in cell wall biosynthesis
VISPQQVAAVVPCLNEARGIGALVEQVKGFLPRVIVVDDGSTDDTASVARLAGARVLRHGRNLGKGAAVDTGLRDAWNAGFEAAVLLDGDGQHDPNCIPAFLSRAGSTGAELVAGNRMGQAGAMPRVRRWVNRGMSAEISRLAGLALPDTQCGFRLLNLRAWRALDFETRRFEVESEMILRFARRGCRIAFVDIDVKPGARRSHIRPLADAVRWFRWRERARSETRAAGRRPVARQAAASC